MSKLVLLGSYACEASDGKPRLVEHFARPHVDHSGGSAAREGLSELRCEGEVLEHAAKGRYRMRSGVELWTDDGEAP